jgi:hypothetical protein
VLTHRDWSSDVCSSDLGPKKFHGYIHGSSGHGPQQ